MTTFSFEIDPSEATRLRAILKAFGVKKLKVKEDQTEMTKEEFLAKLDRSKEGKGTMLKSKEDIHAFFESL